MLTNKSIGVIGAGHIGSAVIGGLLKAKLTSPKNIIASRKSESSLAELAKNFGIQTTTDNKEVARSSDIIILAIKPMNSREVLSEIKEFVTPMKVVVSVMAGIRNILY